MCHAPALRDIKRKQFRQFFCRILCHRISPCTERYQKFIVFIKCHVSMHHTTETHGSKLCQCLAIFFLYILFQSRITVLQSFPDILQTVGPNLIFKAVLPAVTAGCDWIALRIYQNCFNPGGAKFHTKYCLSGSDHLCNFFTFHLFPPPSLCFRIIFLCSYHKTFLSKAKENYYPIYRHLLSCQLQ